MLAYLTQRRRVGVGALIRVRVLEIVVAVTVARNYNNTADSGVRHLDQSVGDDRREDRASLGTPQRARWGLYGSSPVPYVFQGIFIAGVSAGELEEVAQREMSLAMHFTY